MDFMSHQFKELKWDDSFKLKQLLKTKPRVPWIPIVT